MPETLESMNILQVAIAADKFDCVVALKHVSTLWLKPRKDKDIRGLGNLKAAAYILDNAQAFSEITFEMSLYHNGTYLPLAEKEIGLADIVP